MFAKLLNPFNVSLETYEAPKDTRHIHDLFCACNHPRCFGYTPIRWRRELSIK